MNKQKAGNILIWLISLSSIIGICFVDTIPQDLEYHITSDTREIFGVPNFWNVFSNVPFLIVGLMGLVKLKSLKIIEEMSIAYWVLFFGVSLVAFGSGYYHYAPSNETLVWDRLPMTIAFMSLFSIVIAEFINIRKANLLLIPLIIIGVASVFYWQRVDDLRFYALVQFLPIMLIPVIIICYPTKFVSTNGYWLILIAYIIAKFLEHFDAQVNNILGGFISGHSLKHVAAAVGLYLLLWCYKKRVRI